MKRIVVATALVALGSASALAADLGARSYAKAPAMAAVSNWSGLYIGGNVGYGWGDGNTDFSFLPTPALFEAGNTTLGARTTGITGGAQFGYNWQIGSLVTGLEADIQGSNIDGSVHAVQTFLGTAIENSFISSEPKLSWFGTVRGRLGVTVTPDLLLYGTAGLAYGEVEASAKFQVEGHDKAPASVSKTKVGWTAGAGAEWAFAPRWSVKLEYLFVDLGSHADSATNAAGRAVLTHTHSLTEDIARIGVNYRFAQ